MTGYMIEPAACGGFLVFADSRRAGPQDQALFCGNLDEVLVFLRTVLTSVTFRTPAAIFAQVERA